MHGARMQDESGSFSWFKTSLSAKNKHL